MLLAAPIKYLSGQKEAILGGDIVFSFFVGDLICWFQIDGCIDLAVTSEEMQVIDCSVYSLDASATVEEAGTGVQLGGKQLVSITRSAVNFKSLYKDEFMKPNLPFTIKVRCFFLFMVESYNVLKPLFILAFFFTHLVGILAF